MSKKCRYNLRQNVSDLLRLAVITEIKTFNFWCCWRWYLVCVFLVYWKDVFCKFNILSNYFHNYFISVFGGRVQCEIIIKLFKLLFFWLVSLLIINKLLSNNILMATGEWLCGAWKWRTGRINFGGKKAVELDCIKIFFCLQETTN